MECDGDIEYRVAVVMVCDDGECVVDVNNDISDGDICECDLSDGDICECDTSECPPIVADVTSDRSILCSRPTTVVLSPFTTVTSTGTRG